MHEPETRLLLVGSELTEYRRIEALLASAHHAAYRLMWCERFEAAEQEILRGHYDAVLLDCQHQPDDALALLQHCINPDRLLPIIALTRTADCDAVQVALHTGATDFLALNNLDTYVLQRCVNYAVEKYQVDKKLAELNLYDPLTGVPNRQLFLQNLQRAVDNAAQQQTSVALLLINLDGFKRINDSFGTDAGDQTVAMMAQRLSRCVRKTDCLARVGADEFTLVLDDCNNADDISLVANKVIDVLSSPYTLAGQPVMASSSIGIAVFPEAGDSVEQLLQSANMAMKEAKRHRGSQFAFYNKDHSAETMARINLEQDLRLALRRNEFELYYQPRVGLESGETIGMEALIRWRHPTRGMVSPKEFIPVAEDCGLIVPIGYWVIQQVCEDLQLFDSTSQSGLDVAINLSFKQLQDNMFVETATRIIQQSGVDASRLEFELTETAIMSNYQQTYEGMMALAQLGITFSLDDFGTGFSSFAHIQRLPISALKVDRSFVRNVVRNNEDGIIVKAMINLAHSLRLKVIAEGVETLEQVQFLWQNHCDQVQGFYFSPAVSSRDILLMLEQRATAVV